MFMIVFRGLRVDLDQARGFAALSTRKPLGV
jgi:hypothetical protein